MGFMDECVPLSPRHHFIDLTDNVLRVNERCPRAVNGGPERVVAMFVCRTHLNESDVWYHDSLVKQLRDVTQEDGREVSPSFFDGETTVASGKQTVTSKDVLQRGIIVLCSALCVDVVDPHALETLVSAMVGQGRNQSARSGSCPVNEDGVVGFDDRDRFFGRKNLGFLVWDGMGRFIHIRMEWTAEKEWSNWLSQESHLT